MSSSGKVGRESSGSTSSSGSTGTFPRLSLRALLLNGPFPRRTKARKACMSQGKSSSDSDGGSLEGVETVGGRKGGSIRRCSALSSRRTAHHARAQRSVSNAQSPPQPDASMAGSIDFSHKSFPYGGSRSSISTATDEPLPLEDRTVGGPSPPVAEPGASATPAGSTQHLYNRTNSSASNTSNNGLRECVLCLQDVSTDQFPKLFTCSHSACLSCLKQYLAMEISESRVNITCPKCTELMHPTDIHQILDNAILSYKFEDFMLRRVLSMDPDTRWCPAPDCGYAVIATGCAGCPKLKCERPGCASYFCYHCKAEWHPNQTCDMARVQRAPHFPYSNATLNDDDVKACPRCQMLIVKMDDGSCNHMTCSVCGAEFCWLCMKEVSDLHYLSPSGCTFWGKKPWSRKKKVLWQLGTLVGAPLGIALLAGMAVPAIIVGVPIWIGRKIHTKYKNASRHKRNTMMVCGVMWSSLISPVLAGVAVSIGVPILLAYVYGVVPISLCRSGGCGVITSASGVRIAFDDEGDAVGIGGSSSAGSSRVANPAATAAASAIFGASGAAAIRGLSRLGDSATGNGSTSDNAGAPEPDRESASNVAIAPPSITGSIASSSCFRPSKLEVPVEVEGENSALPETLSLAVSERSTNTLDTENASTRALAHYKIDERSETVSLTGVANVAHAGDSASTVLEASGGDNTTACGGPSGTGAATGGVSILSSISANTTTNLYFPPSAVEQNKSTQQQGGRGFDKVLGAEEEDGETVEGGYVSEGSSVPRHMNGSDPRLDSVSAIITARKLSAHAKGVTFSIGSSHSRDHISLNLEDSIIPDSESGASLSGVSNSAVSASAVSGVSVASAVSHCRSIGCGSLSRHIVMASDDECCAEGCCESASLGGNNGPITSVDYGTGQYDVPVHTSLGNNNMLCRSEGSSLHHISEVTRPHNKMRPPPSSGGKELKGNPPAPTIRSESLSALQISRW